MKNFKINLDRKKELHKNYIRSKKGLSALSIGLLLALVLFTICFLGYGLALKDTFVVQDVTSYLYGEKNTFLIGCIVVTVDFILLFLWVIQKIAAKRITGKYLSERINESLIIDNNVLEYGYQNFAGSTAGDRVVVKIPLSNIINIQYYEKQCKLQIRGEICSMYYEDYMHKKTRAKEEYKEGELTLFDYFDPSIARYLQGIAKEKMEVK